jgi:hypothetical protein
MQLLILNFLLTAGGGSDSAPEFIALTDTSVAGFASPDEARQILAADDAFTASLSRFDLQCRLKTDKEITLADWKGFVAEQVRPWQKAEIETVTQSLERISKRLEKYRLPLPPVVRLVRTTGEEESGAAYTRKTAIVLPTKVMSYPEGQLDRLLLHELFHLLSRHDGAVRAKLYRIIGFEVCQPIELPASLAPRRITNPDAPLIDCTIALKAADGRMVTAAPVLYSRDKQYDAKKAESLFRSLVFRLLVVEQRGGRWQPVLTRGETTVIDPRKEKSFLEQIGENTNYIIHPDEIMADNFVRMVMEDKDLQTPRIVEEMRGILGKR